MSTTRRGFAMLPTLLACGACGLHNAQNALDASGPQAREIAKDWWLMLPIASLVWATVVGVMLWGVARERSRRSQGAERPENVDGAALVARDEARERGLTRAVIIAVATTVVILFVVLLADFRVGQSLFVPAGSKVVPIQITGHQFWWEVRYPDSIPQKIVTTANEVHIPVGKPIVMSLTSRDVIHSIWVPNLGGKKDLLPGYTRSMWFRADTPGVYQGQCAEFCGLEHAKMRMLVIAEPQDHYDAWIKSQQQPGSEPTDSITARGRAVFMGTTCVMCHAIAGTPAGATTGPDLTHVASRQTIASGTLANTEGNLLAWISDPQRIKPGTLMPATRLDPRDLHALVIYLRQLK